MYLSWFIENFKFLYSWLRHSYRNFPVPKLPNDIIGPIKLELNWTESRGDTGIKSLLNISLWKTYSTRSNLSIFLSIFYMSINQEGLWKRIFQIIFELSLRKNYVFHKRKLPKEIRSMAPSKSFIKEITNAIRHGFLYAWREDSIILITIKGWGIGTTESADIFF